MSASRVQNPIHSTFNRTSTAQEVLAGVHLGGRNFIVTGGYSGLGLETVRALLEAGAHVTVPARAPIKAEAALAQLAAANSGRIAIAALDLADIASVHRFAADYLASGRTLHCLINNAAVMACPLARVGPGWESQFGICHLGHFALSVALKPALAQAQGARIVSLSSVGHARSEIVWDDVHFMHRSYDKWLAYGQAKTANALFALAADSLWQELGIRAFSVHPGGIFTPLQRHLQLAEMVALGWKAEDGSTPAQVAAMFKSPAQGAATSVWCAVSTQLDGLGGLYCEDCNVAQLAGPNSQRFEHVRPWACDSASAERLWALSESALKTL